MALHHDSRLAGNHDSGVVMDDCCSLGGPATALATVTARNAAQGDGEDDAYGDSCDEAFIDGAAVIRGAGTADFVRARGVFAPPLFVFLANKTAFALIVVAISGAHVDATLV